MWKVKKLMMMLGWLSVIARKTTGYLLRKISTANQACSHINPSQLEQPLFVKSMQSNHMYKSKIEENVIPLSHFPFLFLYKSSKQSCGIRFNCLATLDPFQMASSINDIG